jgi:hypothetical protein
MDKMKVNKTVSQQVEVDLPFYFTDLGGTELYTWTIYGRAGKKNTTIVRVEEYMGSYPEYSVGVKSKPTSRMNFSDYLDKFNQSSEKEFLEALVDAKEWIEENIGTLRGDEGYEYCSKD